jgi:predicted amidohydrolase
LAKRQKDRLRIATCQFAESYRPRRNAVMVRRYIAKAARRRADIVHFHEGALSGYGAGVAAPDYDWAALREATESVLAEARKRRIWVVLGSAHPLTPPHRPHNSLYVISPDGRIVDRYDKRFLMPGDLAVYSPGDHFVTFELKGLTCGLLICYDLRFPELYAELYKRGVRVLFQSFQNAGFDGPGIHQHIMRQTLQARAATNAIWISAPNSSAPYCRWGSVFIQPDGRIAARLPRTRAGLMVNDVDPAARFYDAGSRYRDVALAGRLNNGRLVRDPRSRARTCF